MKYAMLLWPHANSRYQEAVKPLAERELTLLLRCAGIEAQAYCAQIEGVDFLCFEAGALTPDQMQGISRHASLYMLFSVEQEGLLRPVASRARAYLGSDLSGVLKYKGKTNEAFTRLLINYALTASDFSRKARIALFDPMCGRGTALFEALNRGYDACGADMAAADLDEGFRFLKKYLEYHRLKHRVEEKSLTLKGGQSARIRRVELANTREAFDAGETLHASFVCKDAQLAADALSAQRFHIAVCDLPYGVQHGPGGKETLQALLKRTLPAIHRVLKPGGALAISFNTHTLPLDTARSALREAGFYVQEGGAYEGLSHWVEQAIVRDVAVGVKKNAPPAQSI